MLDSLVRVSRRVGWGADRLAADPEIDRTTPGPVTARGQGALRTVLPGQAHREGRGARPGRVRFLGPWGRPTSPGCNTL